MTYDSTTQAQPVMLNGTELKIGDEVIIARGPANPETDTLWAGGMARLIGRRGVYDAPSAQLDSDIRNFGEPVVRITIAGAPWWFRLSEVARARTYHHAAQPATDAAQPTTDTTPTHIPNLISENEVCGVAPHHPALIHHNAPLYRADWLFNERRRCPYDDKHGTLSLRPGFDAYLTSNDVEYAQGDRRQRFWAWSEAREAKRSGFVAKIRKQLTTPPYAGSKKYRTFYVGMSASDRNYALDTYRAQHRTGRSAAKVFGKLVGHFRAANALANPGTVNPTHHKPLPEDEVFRLLGAVFGRDPDVNVTHPARAKLRARIDLLGDAVRAYDRAIDKLGGEWAPTPWTNFRWFANNTAAQARIPHISVEKPQEVAYYQSVDKLIRGIETRTKPGRFLTKFFPNLTPDEVRTYANDYLVATAPKQLHFARTMEEIITAIDEGPSESCQTRSYYGKNTDERPWYRGHLHPAATYASGDFEVLYITDDNHPADLTRLHAETQRITARAICNAKGKRAARIYGDAAKMLPLLTSAGYTQVERALVGCRLLKIENEEGSGYLMPYVDAGIGSGGGSLDVDDWYDHESGREYWMLVRPENGEHSTYEGYDKKGVLDPDEEPTHYCPRCNAEHDDEDDIHYSDYEEESYCSSCEDDFVNAVVRVTRSGYRESDRVFQDNAIEIDGDWYVNDDELLSRCGFVQCVHCADWASLDDTTTTDSGQVCGECDQEVVELAEESPDGNEYGYRPDCSQYVNTETGETVWLDDNSDADDYTTSDDEGEEVPLYVSPSEWGRMQGKAQDKYDFQGPPERSPVAYSATVEMPLERITRPYEDHLTI